MIIKSLLIGLLIIGIIWFLGNRNTSKARAGTKLVMIAFVIISATAIINPYYVTEVANALGVGRGTDLLLYIFIFMFMFFCIIFYSKYKDEQKRNVLLARKIALLEVSISKIKK